ncbi:MAG: prepilin peptidase [Puniceicoccales bacterium]
MSTLELIHEINAAHPWFFAFWAFVFGACWGSFLNVVIYRMPAGKSVVRPGSHCYACGKAIAWYDNLPILSWLILRGKARCCGAPFSIRYALIEALTGGLYLWTWIQYSEHFAVVAALYIFIALMVAGSFIDYDTQMLPDLFTVWGLIIGFVLSCLIPELHGQGGSGDPRLLEGIRSGVLSATGAVVGAGVILWVAMLAETLLRKEAMGFGDVLLMGCIGAFIGWKGAIFAIFGGALLGTFVVIPIMILQKLFGLKMSVGKTTKSAPAAEDSTQAKQPEADASNSAQDAPEKTAETNEQDADLGFGVAIPFGPWLALGALVYLLVAHESVDAYFESMQALVFSPLGM